MFCPLPYFFKKFQKILDKIRVIWYYKNVSRFHCFFQQWKSSKKRVISHGCSLFAIFDKFQGDESLTLFPFIKFLDGGREKVRKVLVFFRIVCYNKKRYIITTRKELIKCLKKKFIKPLSAGRQSLKA